MNFQRINKLLEKYYDGETSLAEEKDLRSFFETEEVPRNLKFARDQFRFYSRSYRQEHTDEDFEEKFLEKLRHLDTVALRSNRRTWMFMISSAVASIVILITLFFHFNMFTRNIEDTMSNPETAYNEAKKVMYFVSEKFNKGTGQLQAVGTFNKGLENARSIGQFDVGMEEASRINEYNKMSKYINNLAD